MKRKKSILKLVFVVSILATFFSCLDEDQPSVAFGDALIKSVQRGDSVYYGTYFYAYSSEKMAKVTVFREGEDSKITLDSVKGRYTFSYTPDSLEYKTSKPLRAKYIFDVYFDDNEQYEASDILESNSLLPVVISECKFNSEEQKLVIDWEVNTQADQYLVLLRDEDNEIVFQSELINANQSELWIASGSNGWISGLIPEGGERYKVNVYAYQYEPIPTAFDLQSVSVAESEFFDWNIIFQN